MTVMDTRVPLVIPVIITAVGMFLAIHGPRDWRLFWLELTNPPLDARHAIRRNVSSGAGAMHRYLNLKMQYLNYVRSVENALKNQLKDHKSRVALVRRFYTGVNLREDHIKEVASILAPFNMYDLQPVYHKLLYFARINLIDLLIRRGFIEKTNEFMLHFQRILAGKNNFL